MKFYLFLLLLTAWLISIPNLGSTSTIVETLSKANGIKVNKSITSIKSILLYIVCKIDPLSSESQEKIEIRSLTNGKPKNMKKFHHLTWSTS